MVDDRHGLEMLYQGFSLIKHLQPSIVVAVCQKNERNWFTGRTKKPAVLPQRVSNQTLGVVQVLKVVAGANGHRIVGAIDSSTGEQPSAVIHIGSGGFIKGISDAQGGVLDSARFCESNFCDCSSVLRRHLCTCIAGEVTLASAYGKSEFLVGNFHANRAGFEAAKGRFR